MVKEFGQILALGLVHHGYHFIGFLENRVSTGGHHLAITDNRDHRALIGKVERADALANGF